MGEWEYVSGTLDFRCHALGTSDSAALVHQRVWLQLGVDSDLVYSDPETSCVWALTLTEDATASLDAGQSCTFTEGGITYSGSYGPAAFTLDGSKVTFSGSMALTASVAGATYHCIRTTRGQLVKISSSPPPN